MPRPRILVAVALAIAALAGGGILWMRLATPYHFLEVEPGVLYRSGGLAAGDLAGVIGDHGIRTVVNLRSKAENREPWHAAEAAVCRERGVRLVDLPMEKDAPPAPAQVDAWLALLRDPANLPVLVHCEYGVIRTGMMVAVWEIENSERSNREVFEALPMFGHRREGGVRDRFRDFILGYGRSSRSPPGR